MPACPKKKKIDTSNNNNEFSDHKTSWYRERCPASLSDPQREKILDDFTVSTGVGVSTRRMQKAMTST